MRQNRIYIIILATLLSLCNSCKDTGPINYQNSVITLKPQNLSLSTKEVFFNTPQASTSTFQVNSTNVEWEITGIPDWMTISPTSGSDNTTVTVTVTENPLTSNRMGIVSFSSTDDSWSFSSPLTVSQFRAAYFATPETDRIEFDGVAATASIKIDSNVDDWSVNTGTSMNWCTVSKDDGCINISITPNSSWATRSGQIEISTIDDTEYITILQHPAKIFSTTDQLDFTSIGGEITIEINLEAPWVASTSCTWIDVSPTSGPAGKNTISVKATANNSLNTRKDYFFFVYSDDNKIQIPVSQEEVRFDIDKTEIESLASGKEDSVYIESNASWSVIDCPSWIQVTPDTGIGSGTLIITITKNTEPSERFGCITVSPDNMDYPFYIDVWQEGVISSDNSSMHFYDEAGYLYLSIYTNYNWTALASDNWITLDAESGFGNAQLKVSVTENTTDTIRKGYVIITAENTQMKVLIEQQGKYLNILSDALNFSSKGGSTQVTLNSNDSWTAIASNDWISLSTTEGNGNGNITITTADNPSATARSSYVDIIPVVSKPIRITVNQAARYIKASISSLKFTYMGGTSTPITINTDGVAQVSTDATWLTINKESNTKFTVTASKNEGSSDRTGKVIVTLTDLADGTLSTTVTVNQRWNGDNGHFFVDLGLSVMWATCNIGATEPEGYGNHYAWGETKIKSSYDWLSYYYCEGEYTTLTKYCDNSSYGNSGFTDNKTTLEISDDVARSKWGGSWRMPTTTEFQELIDNCTWTWTTQNSVNGYKVTSNKPGYTNNSIFLPAAGSHYNTRLNSQGSAGGYWSSSLFTTIPRFSWTLQFDSDDYKQIGLERYWGFSVRPVCP